MAKTCQWVQLGEVSVVFPLKHWGKKKKKKTCQLKPFRLIGNAFCKTVLARPTCIFTLPLFLEAFFPLMEFRVDKMVSLSAFH